MIREHCGQPLWYNSDNKFYFRRQCQVCKRIFKQGKRQPMAGPQEYELHPDVAADEPVTPSEFSLMIVQYKVRADVDKVDDAKAERLYEALMPVFKDFEVKLNDSIEIQKLEGIRVEATF